MRGLKVFFGAGLLLVSTMASAAEALHVSSAWIREAPANAKALGAFVTIANPSTTPRSLVAARTPVADMVQLHKSVMEDGVARMVAQDAIEVPAQGEARLQPGGLHMMLMGPRQHLKAGDKVEITLEFNDGVTMPVMFEVRNGGHGPAGGH